MRAADLEPLLSYHSRSQMMLMSIQPIAKELTSPKIPRATPSSNGAPMTQAIERPMFTAPRASARSILRLRLALSSSERSIWPITSLM